MVELNTKYRGELDPYDAFELDAAPASLRYALESFSDLNAGCHWFEQGRPPDPDAKSGVHPNRRHLKAIGMNRNGRWLTTKSARAAYTERDGDVLDYHLNPVHHVTMAGTVFIQHLKRSLDDEVPENPGARFKPGSYHVVHEMGGPGVPQFKGVYEMSGTDAEHTLPDDLLKNRAELGPGAIEAVRGRLG